MAILADGWHSLDAEDQKKLSEIVWGMEGHGSHIKDHVFIENCLSPHWATDKQVHWINTKWGRLNG